MHPTLPHVHSITHSSYFPPHVNRLHRVAFGDLRLKKESNYMPFFGGLVQNQVLVMQPPTLKVRGSVVCRSWAE